MISEKTAKKLETDIEWNGRANVCVHCGMVPETFYVATGHDHTDYDIRWCPCREPNPNWCAGCSPDNCSGCGGEPVGYVAHGSTMPRNIRVFSGCEILNKERASEYMPECISPLYTTPQPDRTAELEAALRVARDVIDKFLVANNPTEFGCACDLSVGYLCGPCHADMQQQPLKSAIAKINEVLGHA